MGKPHFERLESWLELVRRDAAMDELRTNSCGVCLDTTTRPVRAYERKKLHHRWRPEPREQSLPTLRLLPLRRLRQRRDLVPAPFGHERYPEYSHHDRSRIHYRTYFQFRSGPFQRGHSLCGITDRKLFVDQAHCLQQLNERRPAAADPG